MKVTFNDDETKRILQEFAAVNASRIQMSKTIQGAIKKEKQTINEYAKKIDKWVNSKIKWNYKAEVKKSKKPL